MVTRILFVAHLDPATEAGPAIHIGGRIRAMLDEGVGVTLLSLGPLPAPPLGLESVTVSVAEGRLLGLRVRRAMQAATGREIRRAEKLRDPYSIVYIRGALPGPAVEARAARIPPILEINSNLLDEMRLSGASAMHIAAAARRERTAFDLADGVLSLGHFVTLDVAERFPAMVPRMTTIPIGVDTALFHPLADAERTAARRRFGIPADAFVLGFAGNLWDMYNFTGVITALPKLPKNVCIAIAGEGPARQLIEQLAREHAVVPRIHLLGRLPHADINAFYAACDVGLQPHPPGGLAGFGMKTHEYISAGLPILCPGGTGMEEATDHRLGVLTPDNSAESYLAAVPPFMQSPLLTPSERARLHAHAAAQYGWPGRIREFLAWVNALTKGAVH
jgi:glycosyltransferase involved in cell wall biosynthesis